MSLINCPECGNECSATAVACPQCGYTFVKPVVEPQVIVQEVVEEDSFPRWIFVPLALLGALGLLVLFVMLRSDEDPNQRNINVNIASQRQTERTQTTNTTVPSTSQPSTVTVPSSSQPSTITAPSSTETIPSTTTTTTIPEPAPDKGAISMEAKVFSRSGKAQPASGTRFYLLDKDLDSILSEARIEDEEGQGLVNAFGLSVVYPNRYSETNQKALAAIKRHTVYATTTDASGKAQIKDVKPKSYYLFAVTKTGNGFAIWNSPVSINAGQNVLNLEPVTPTEVVNQ